MHLVINTGSSSLKFSLFEAGAQPILRVRGQFDLLATRPRFVAKDASGQTIGSEDWPSTTELSQTDAIEFLFNWWQQRVPGEPRLTAAGHRVVHGGAKFMSPVRVDLTCIEELQALVPLAPLHQPQNLEAIRVLAELDPELPQVVCFDTAFHQTQSAVAQAFALPRRLSDEGIRRYGFHGLSYEYIASELQAIDPSAASGRTVVAHLGNGASMCALAGGRSVATTMGFTAVDGLPMGTRSGSLDPGVLLYLMDQHGFDTRRLEKLLYQESGLLGVSGISSDMRTLLASSSAQACEAIDLFVYRIGRELGSLAAALGGLDAVVFTGGIGENAAPIRARVCRDAAWLGLKLDEHANERGATEESRPSGGSNAFLISLPESAVATWVVPTNEELMIARHIQQVLHR